MQRLFSCMEQRNIDVALLCTQENITYCTGFDTPLPYGALYDFTGYAPLSYAVVNRVTQNVVLVVPAMQEAAARSMVRNAEVVTFEHFDHFAQIDIPASMRKTFSEVFERYVKGARRVAIEYRALPIGVYEILSSDRDITFEEATPLMREAKKVKRPHDLEMIRKAVELGDTAQQVFLDYSRGPLTGKTEMELWGDVCCAVNKAAGNYRFATGELITGERIRTMCPGGPWNRVIEAGDMGLMDISIRTNGYWCDCTNTVVFGAEPTPEQRAFYGMIQDAYDAAFEQLRPGRRLSDAAFAADKAFGKYGRKSCVYTGHQIGFGVNEEPRIVEYEDDLIVPDMVVCIEPQHYGGAELPYGARLEKVIHITENGPIELNKFERGIQF